jgi:hypothetical protein
MMMEAARSSEMLVNFYQATWCNNPKHSHIQVKKCVQSVKTLEHLLEFDL